MIGGVRSRHGMISAALLRVGDTWEVDVVVRRRGEVLRLEENNGLFLATDVFVKWSFEGSNGVVPGHVCCPSM